MYLNSIVIPTNPVRSSELHVYSAVHIFKSVLAVHTGFHWTELIETIFDASSSSLPAFTSIICILDDELNTTEWVHDIFRNCILTRFA